MIPQALIHWDFTGYLLHDMITAMSVFECYSLLIHLMTKLIKSDVNSNEVRRMVQMCIFSKTKIKQ